jgi:hypothetical protein
MAVDIIVEDGTNVPGANSFNTVVELEAFANQRGINLPADGDAKARLLIKAMDYLALYGERWKGELTYDTDPVQSLPFPRTDIWVDGIELGDTEIPYGVKAAQLHLSGIAASGVELTPSTAAGLPVIMEKIGPITTQYAAPMLLSGADWTRPEFPVVEALLAPLLVRGFGLTTVRI